MKAIHLVMVLCVGMVEYVVNLPAHLLTKLKDYWITRLMTDEDWFDYMVDRQTTKADMARRKMFVSTYDLSKIIMGERWVYKRSLQQIKKMAEEINSNDNGYSTEQVELSEALSKMDWLLTDYMDRQDRKLAEASLAESSLHSSDGSTEAASSSES